MTIDLKNNEGILAVAPIGRLDSLTAGELETALEGAINDDIKSLVLNMKQVDFVSSKGLRVLVGAYKKMNGREVVINNANSSIMEVLKLSGLLKIFTVNE